MRIVERDVVVIGGGPAGLAAALAVRGSGVESVTIIERDYELGGILNQCIHNGFGVHVFGEELTGPEYASRFVRKVVDQGIEYLTDSMVTEIDGEKNVFVASPSSGLMKIEAKAVVLAMGCRERTRPAINIPGTRPAGVFTAGSIQHLINIDGYLPGKRALIVGSGDIGLIMARRLTLEGVKVEGVVEIMSYPGGLNRNIAQCLNDFGIPLYLGHTVSRIHGMDRIEGATVAPVDEKRLPIMEKSRYIPCDTLVLSVGLIPENELSRMAGVAISSVTGGPIVDENLQTSLDGIFACGNVLHVHDLVDFVTRESERAGRSAAAYVRGDLGTSGVGRSMPVRPGKGVRYVVPNFVSLEQDVEFFLRASRPMESAVLRITPGLKEVRQRAVKPSEMISVRIPASLLSRAAGSDGIRFELE